MSSRQVPLPGLLLVLMLPCARDARAQAPDRVCSSPEIRAGLVLRVRSSAPSDTTRGSVIGPLVRCTGGYLVLGRYPGQDDPELQVPTHSIHRLWVRDNARVIGGIAGTIFGAASGGAIAAVRTNICYRANPPASYHCHGDIVAGALIGGAVGGLAGWVLGRGFPHWSRIFP
jgi:hypothetical protein